MSFPLWQQAISFAARAHRGHVRRDGVTPYAAHPFRVAMAVLAVFECRDEVALVAAVLHDTIEDTPTDFDDIESAFGTEVAEVVAALTKNMLLREADRELDYDRRLAAAPWQARLVKLGDTYDNLADAHWPGSGNGAKRRQRAIDRARRTIELARPDADVHPEIARAIDTLQLELESVQV